MECSKARAYLLHGYLGAGKTTFARRLEAEQNALRFTQDEWMVRLFGHDPAEADFPDHHRRILEVMESQWTRCLQLGVNVVLDFGFWSRVERDRARDLVRAHGGEAVLYRLTCAESVAWARIQERNEALKNNLFIAENTFKTLASRFEPLGADEDRVEQRADRERG